MTTPVQRKPGQFQPGISGNPSGRPKIASEIKELLRDNVPLAVKRLGELMSSKNDATALAALNIYFDRLCGKPVQAVEADVRQAVDIRQMFLDATRTVNAQARAAEDAKVIEGKPVRPDDEW